MSSERTGGLYRALQLPMLYEIAQHALGSDSSRRRFVRDFIRPVPGDRVLDVGCGTAELSGFLDDVEYVGFDPNPDYIATARERFPDVRVEVAGISEAATLDLGTFDIIVAKGVLHHLGDDQVRAVARLASDHLRNGGRFVSVDPCFVESQRFVARFLVQRDRGANVRYPNEYQSLIETSLTKCEVSHHRDFLRVPYDHAVVQASAA